MEATGNVNGIGHDSDTAGTGCNIDDIADDE